MKIDHFIEEKFVTDDQFEILYGSNFKCDHVDFSLPTLIFNYGLVCNLAHWKYQIPYFDQLGYPIVYHDYRFHFGSSSSQNINDLNFIKISEDTHQLIEHLSIKQFIMLGHSMGVNTTLEYCRRFPDIMQGMILISGTVLPPQDIMFDTNWMEIVQPMLETLLEKYPKVFKAVWETGHKNPIANLAIHRGGFNTKEVPMEFVTYYLKKIGELKPEVFFQLLKEMKEQNITPDLENIATKSLVITGDQDQVIPSYLQYILIENLQNTELYTVKDGSHVPQVDFPQSINERIQIFIEELLESSTL